MTTHLKVAVGDEGVARLEAEAAVLDAIRHPGVVELLLFTAEAGVAELGTAEVVGPTLAAAAPLPAREVAGVAAAVATTLADLHDTGFVHGNIDATHVLLGPAGPVLCGFGSAGRIGGERQAVDDVAALLRVVEDLAGESFAEATRGVRDARALAAALQTVTPDALLPRRPTIRDHTSLEALLRPDGRRPSRLRIAAIAAAVVVFAAVGLQLLRAEEPPVPVRSLGPRTSTTAPAPTARSDVTQVWPTTTTPPPEVAIAGRRYQIAEPGGVAVAGPWGCPPRGAAAVLRPGTGQVFVFAEAAPESTGAPAATVVGATGLAVRDLDDDGCTELVAERGDGTPVEVAP